MVTTGFEETSMYQWIQSYLTSVPGGLPDVENDPYGSTLYAFRIAYVLMMTVTAIRTATMTRPYYETKVRLFLCLAYRTFPALLMSFLPLRSSLNGEFGFLAVVCDGLFIAVVTTDILVCRMAQRQLHPWVVMMGMLSLVSSATCLMFSTFYAFKLFQELCNYSNESLLSANINVYCDGVYDLCHEGHMAAFSNALKNGPSYLLLHGRCFSF